MKVLITSGGTKIPIDSVRFITNRSNGTLGSKLAEKALLDGNEVVFFRAEKSKSPMSIAVDFMKKDPESWKIETDEVLRTWNNYKHHYTELEYKTFEDYQDKLPKIIALYKPDVIVLAAAVSDYAPETVMNGKIRTKTDLTIPLKPLPKVISNVREWAGDKAKIVGFKLLVDVPEEELIEAAKDSLVKNKLDLVCANDLKTILAGNHIVHLVSSCGSSCEDASLLWSSIRRICK